LKKQQDIVEKAIEHLSVHYCSDLELWLEKLESGAVLSLLRKIEITQCTPSALNAIVYSCPCRIGASVVLLSDAIWTMFEYNVAQVKAL